jgi:peptide-methionine (S)-S-oxide reductase
MSRLVALICALALGVALSGRAAQARDVQTAIFAGGCFWCVEADFDKVDGVLSTTSGFIGGTTPNPTYREVTGGGTGHYEAVKIEFDADRVSYRQLVDIFWRSVDPTDAGGQFCDRGPSYRTAIFAVTPAQAAEAEASRAAAEAALRQKIVTPVLPAGPFTAAGEEHQDYYKGGGRVLTRFGIIRQADAYERYREGCGRDARVRALWGDAAPFAR